LPNWKSNRGQSLLATFFPVHIFALHIFANTDLSEQLAYRTESDHQIPEGKWKDFVQASD
jgi:hypothetical protein